MLRALPASAALIWPKISALGATPVPPYPLFFGGYPHRGYPTPFVFLFSSPCMPCPTRARVPLVHAAAAWHRLGQTPLMFAASNDATAAVASLVERRADLDAQDNTG